MDTTLDLDTWTNPRTGQVRQYINNWAEAAGIRIRHYKTGNVASASYKGERIANNRATDLDRARAWVDSHGTVHLDGFYVRGDLIDAATVLADLQATYDAEAPARKAAKKAAAEAKAKAEEENRRAAEAYEAANPRPAPRPAPFAALRAQREQNAKREQN